MDRLTNQLEEAGIRADVYEFTICRLIAAQAIRRLPPGSRSDRPDRSLDGRALRPDVRGDPARGKHPGEPRRHHRSGTRQPEGAAQRRALSSTFSCRTVYWAAAMWWRSRVTRVTTRASISRRARGGHPHQHRQDGFRPPAIGDAIAQLTTTPAKAEGEAVPLRYVVPPERRSNCGTVARRYSPVRAIRCKSLRRFTTCRCGRSPRSIRCRTVHR